VPGPLPASRPAIAFGIAVGIAYGIAVGIANGITVGIANGITVEVAGGIPVGIAFPVSLLRAYYWIAHSLLVWPGPRPPWYPWHPVAWPIFVTSPGSYSLFQLVTIF
jgi:hypothetical protein